MFVQVRIKYYPLTLQGGMREEEEVVVWVDSEKLPDGVPNAGVDLPCDYKKDIYVIIGAYELAPAYTHLARGCWCSGGGVLESDGLIPIRDL